MLRDLIKNNRSYRRFFQDETISNETLRELTDLARLSPSPRNKQSLKFILTSDRPTNALVFETLVWAAYLTNWKGPEEGERPSGYITILADRELSPSFEADMIATACGIAAQSILLGATEIDLGGCMIASINRTELRKVLKIEEKYDILMVLALGMPKEQVVFDDVKNGDVKYWRDEKQIHHVPKRTLDELIVT